MSSLNGLSVNVQIRFSAAQLAALPCEVIGAITDLAASAIGLHAIASRVEAQDMAKKCEHKLQLMKRARICLDWMEEKGYEITDDFQIVEIDGKAKPTEGSDGNPDH